MGDSDKVKPMNNDEKTGVFYPTFTNKSELFQYSSDGFSDQFRWKDVRPIVPFSPVFIRPKCGVCGLQASVGLSKLKANTDKSKLVLPYVTQLQTALEIDNWKQMKKLVGQAGDGVIGIGRWNKTEFINLGFSGFVDVEQQGGFRTQPVVLVHDERGLEIGMQASLAL